MPAIAKSVLLAGATGLVGRECVRLLLADPEITRVVALSRRPLSPEVRAPKLELKVVDFDELTEHGDLFAVDSIICAIGTTIKQAGSQLRFRVVDYEYPLMMARLGQANGATHFVLVTGWGAAIDIKDAQARGVHEVIAKPYRISDLRQVADRLASGKDAGSD